MRFTINRCATEGMEETYDRYEEELENDPAIHAIRMRIKKILHGIRDILNKGDDPDEKLRLIDELEDEYVNLETEELKIMSRIGCNNVQLAFKLGWECCELEKRGERPLQCESDERGLE